jgi:IS30 family transposase
MIGPLPKSGEYDAILVIVDYLTKMGHFLPTTTTATSTTVMQAYIDNVFKLHGMSESMTSDRGPQFASSFATETKRLMGIESRLSTAYRPETDGQTECTNRKLEIYLRRFVNYEQDD